MDVINIKQSGMGRKIDEMPSREVTIYSSGIKRGKTSMSIRNNIARQEEKAVCKDDS